MEPTAGEQLVSLEKEIIAARNSSQRIVATLEALEKELTAEWLRVRSLLQEQ